MPRSISDDELVTATGGQAFPMPGGPRSTTPVTNPIGRPLDGLDRAAASGEATAQRGGGGGGGGVPQILPLLY